MQECTKCHQVKKLDEFALDSRGRNGRVAKCRLCMREYSRQYRAANPDKAKTYYANVVKSKNKERYANDPQYREHILRRLRESYQRNAEKRKASVKKYAALNKDKISERTKLYRQKPENRKRALLGSKKYRDNPANKPILALRSRQYQSRKLGCPGTCTLTQLQARIEYYGNACWICRGPYTAIDHYKPVSKGGWNWPANLRPICKSCNSSKSNKWPFAPEMIHA